MSFSVIIPSRNAANLAACVRAVRGCEPPDAEIIVVWDRSAGNGFIPPTEDYCVRDVESDFVFARNVNIGITEALHPGSACEVMSLEDYGRGYHHHPDRPTGVVILNDDALLRTPGGFSLLAKTAAEHPELGMIAATCNNVGNENQWPKNLGLRNEPRMVCFVAVFIPRRTLDAVGLLDERFVGYGLDDDDYCLRVRKAGLKIGIHDGCYVDHGSLTSSYRGAAGAGGDFFPNMKLFIEKWGVDNWGKDRAHSQFARLFPAA